ncbi:hypothetical protein DMC25_13390 [Caulobacter sp. D4A]|uniref:GIN domain-containing protein n=1 Tax=unclassified Caulobacter TaxID=2648921 RepID=UPI000D736215|nr:MULTISPECIES: DUF2807 domain-containing protein [unclassified Caulobacter]PXA86714.1 hypothetical protein DMC25_13390 [Caulobacter sp. D4A]PXA95314.1 hypothetical protein DMC18_04195 [Caulobacter sp. D5]
MRAIISLAAGAAVLALAGTASASEANVKIKDAVARVVVIPEARSDVKVEFLTRNSSLPLEVRVVGGQTIIDGNLHLKRIQSCNGSGDAASVKVRNLGVVKWADIPQVVVRVPQNVSVGASGAVYGSIGRSDSVELANAGCGDWTVANTKGKLEISLAGSGDTKAGSADRVEISLAGSGDISLQEVRELEVAIAGSGDVKAAAIHGGDIDVSIAGSGGVKITQGRARDLDVSIMGSGDVNFGGEADKVSLSVAGSGDVRVAKVNGPVKKSSMGSGNIYIGQ